MKHLISLFALTGILSFPACSQEADFSGTFSGNSGDQQYQLELKATGGGEYAGNLSGGGMTIPLNGQAENGVLRGNLGDEASGMTFTAVWDQGKISMEFTDGMGGIDVVLFSIERGASAVTLHTERVVINGKELGESEIADLERTYSVRPKPGRYWYDARSGLYGVEGYPGYGFMRPGHRFGSLNRDASKGDTGVIINGRELPAAEYTVWSYIVGSWIQPGSYWLDGDGNAGYEGNPVPVINLYAAAQQNSYRGQGSGGDNFWSTRFSAGNYNADNSQGYVSVPGYGPIGYGF